MTRQSSHPDQADADGRTQANRVSEWGLKIVVLGPDFSLMDYWSLCVLCQPPSPCRTQLMNVGFVCACVQ